MARVDHLVGPAEPDELSGERRNLRGELRRAQRRVKLGAWALLCPALLFVGLAFVAPIGLYLFRSVDNSEVPELLPQTTKALAAWDGTGLPPDDAFAALAKDLRKSREDQTVGRLARRLNYNIVGFRGLINGTARKVTQAEIDAPMREALPVMDARWGEARFWATIKRESGRITPFYLLASIDLEITPAGQIRPVAAQQALYISVFLRTFWISACVVLLCTLLGYPTAYALSILPPRITNILLIFVMIPFWTSLLVRTTAWAILLQNTGPVNGFLQWIGLIADPLPLMFNRTGVLTAMTHVLLPFLILPLYGVMKGISPSQTQAAASLGAKPFLCFWAVYFPQTVPGLAAGVLLVFILALGYYVTPAIVGGANDQMISYFIALFTDQTLNWGQAAALGTWLLIGTFVLFALYSRVVGLGKMRLG